MGELYDIRTVMMCIGLMLVAASVGTGTAAWVMRRFASLPVWTFVFLTQGSAMLLSSLRGVVAADLSILLSNALMLIGQITMPFALARDLHQPFRGRLLWPAALLSVALFAWAYWVAPWTELRTVAVSMVGSVAFLQSAAMVRRHLREPESAGIAWGMLFPLLIIGLVYLSGLALTTWHVLHYPPIPEAYPGAEMLSPGNPRMPLLLIDALCIAALAYSVILHVALRLNRALQHQASHDGLTGLSNRSGFEQQAMRLLARHQSQQQPCALLFVDLDHFKRINDDHGHAAGDHVLSSFAALLKRELRHRDLVARFGGEEFCVFLPDTTPDEACVIARRLCEATQEMRLFWQKKPIPLSTSIGLAPALPQGSLASLILAADRALYAAKDAGRNQVVLAA